MTGGSLALSIDDAGVDLGRFTRWTTAGTELLRAERYAEASARFPAALSEWSGPALADLRGLRWVTDEIWVEADY